MKRKLIHSAYQDCTAAINALEQLKSNDIKDRKKAKPSAKRAWTSRINSISLTIDFLRMARKVIRMLPKRVVK